jgi:hypothetical protein
MRELETKVFEVVSKNPKISKIQLCRCLNGKFKYYCNRMQCFANPRKRKSFTIFKPDCKISRNRVFYALKKLQEKKLVVIKRMKKPDGKNNRGWDWFQCCFSNKFSFSQIVGFQKRLF